jgi:flavin reductase (DIM6/NTAB) family NADH-FMN oxidoreductase RutF
MNEQRRRELVELPVNEGLWERVFTVAPLVLVGTREEDGSHDLAPKHMVTPVGFDGYWAFVCTPQHRTYWNVRRERQFTVSYCRPTQVLLASLAAAPRCGDDGEKTSLEAIPTFPAEAVDGVCLADGYFFLECELDRILDGFGAHSLILGRIVAARVARGCMRVSERSDQQLVQREEFLTYLSPGRYAAIRKSYSFPFSENLED